MLCGAISFTCKPDSSPRFRQFVYTSATVHFGIVTVPLLIVTTILWAFSFSLIGEYLAGQVDSWFSVLMRLALAAIVFLPFLRWRGYRASTILLYMLVGMLQLGIMYLLSFEAYLYLSVTEFLLFTVMTPLYVTLITICSADARCVSAMPSARCWQ